MRTRNLRMYFVENGSNDFDENQGLGVFGDREIDLRWSYFWKVSFSPSYRLRKFGSLKRFSYFSPNLSTKRATVFIRIPI